MIVRRFICMLALVGILFSQIELVWNDEFDGDGEINSINWFHQTKLPWGSTWFNGEIQHYTDRADNSYVSNGTLKIVAKKESYTDQGHTKDYTSARLNSKYAFMYGLVEIRAKLPQGVGTWPAIWMVGKNIDETGAYWETQGYGTTSWPYCGEVDILEHWGTNQNYVQSAVHTPSSYGSTVNLGGQYISTASSQFNVYTLEWTAQHMVFSVNGIVHFTYDPETKNSETWPFSSEQYLVLNIAILPGISSGFTESEMEIDYVRIYASPNLSSQIVTTPKTYNLNQNHPNPFNPGTTINYALPEASNVRVSIYNIKGQEVATLANDFQEAGYRSLWWNGTDNSGNKVSGGMYLYRIQAGSFTKTMKMVLLK